MHLVSRYAPYEAYPYSEPDVRFSHIRLPTKLIIHIHVSHILTYLFGLASGYLFIRHTAPYCKLSTKICNNALYSMLPDRKSIKHKGFHVTRRTFATNMLRSQSEIDAMMNALGHTDNTIVMKYLSFDSEGMGIYPLSLSECGIGSGGLYRDI